MNHTAVTTKADLMAGMRERIAIMTTVEMATLFGCRLRIMLHPQAPEGRPWFSTITARVPQSTHDRGYSVRDKTVTERRSKITVSLIGDACVLFGRCLRQSDACRS